MGYKRIEDLIWESNFKNNVLEFMSKSIESQDIDVRFDLKSVFESYVLNIFCQSFDMSFMNISKTFIFSNDFKVYRFKNEKNLDFDSGSFYKVDFIKCLEESVEYEKSEDIKIKYFSLEEIIKYSKLITFNEFKNFLTNGKNNIKNKLEKLEELENKYKYNFFDRYI